MLEAMGITRIRPYVRWNQDMFDFDNAYD
jgi:hypothetical protein